MAVVILTIHVIACALLIALILVQAGRGGGLVDTFSGVESMLGTKTNTFLTRATTVLSIIFFITCLSLALLSAKQSRSLMKDIKSNTGGVATAPAQGQAASTAPIQTVPIQQGTTQEAPKAE